MLFQNLGLPNKSKDLDYIVLYQQQSFSRTVTDRFPLLTFGTASDHGLANHNHVCRLQSYLIWTRLY